TTSIDGAGEFTVKFRAEKAGKLSEMLQLSSRITRAEAYNVNGQNLEVALRFNGNTIAGVGFELYQNQPNPWVNRTQIGFHLPAAATATLTVYDETGRVLFTQKGDFAKGYNAISLDRAVLNTTGLLYYKLETATDSATRKMVQTR
ncbi:MAG: T9SS type A sorting domain-containing protein, partial [Saprospiraceae bacterium]|nr:T9SS type A sorting domain-containing protein [Saprospiraceae bacterium]